MNGITRENGIKNDMNANKRKFIGWLKRKGLFNWAG